MLRLALIGNPNSGKTTLFNLLTGSRARVGNFPGVTVEKTSRALRGRPDVELTDLPGVYSLSPYTAEELVTRDFLMDERPDAVINIIDCTAAERGLYLTLQLLSLGLPTVVAFNMADELRAGGGRIDTGVFSKALGVRCIAVSALQRTGIRALTDAAVRAAREGSASALFPYTGACAFAVRELRGAVASISEAAGVPSLFAARKLLEGDAPLETRLHLTAAQRALLERRRADVTQAVGCDCESAMIDNVYRFITTLCQTALQRAASPTVKLSLRADRLLTGRWTGLPIFAAVMALVFYLTFGPLGRGLSELAGRGVDWLAQLLETLLCDINVNSVLRALVIDGLVRGVGSVVSFLPTIAILFTLLSMLEDSGYMARAAFITDRALSRIGLSGSSFAPLLLGFGCTVPAVMAARTVPDARSRRLTVLLLPFVSCSAKLPVLALFAAAFFRRPALALFFLYTASIAVGILAALVLKKTLFRAAASPFVMELPPYRLPALRTTVQYIRQRIGDFVRKAFSVILFASLVVWFLQTFDFRLRLVASPADSMLADIGGALSVLFYPLGWRDWRLTAALITGLTAKEAVLSTLAVLTGAETGVAVSALFPSVPAAAAFCVFVLLYPPCAAAMAAVRRETSGRFALGLFAFQTAVAYLCAMLVFRVGLWLS